MLIISPSFRDLHCSSVVHMNHMEPNFPDLPLYCTNKVLKNHNQFCHFFHRDETHFMVHSHTLIYRKPSIQEKINLLTCVDWSTDT